MAFREFVVTLIATAASIQSVFAATVGLEPRKETTMKWQGPVFAGKADHVFHVRDVDDLWGQIAKANPKFTIGLAAPDEGNFDRGLRVCGPQSQIATGNTDNIVKILTRIASLQGFWFLPPNECHRIGCGDDAGVYWCNDSNKEVKASAKDIFNVANGILSNCCLQPGTSSHGSVIAGVENFHQKHAAGSTRIGIGYGACKDNVNIVPLVYRYPGEQGECPKA